MHSAAGSLLIAHPSLQDPNFRRSVLLLSQHDPDEGAFGFILNRPSGRTVADLLPNRPELGPLAKLPVFLGGPVGSDQLIFASFHWEVSTASLECRHHVPMHEAIELLHEESAVVRPYIGYAGWGKGQLEAELAQHAWLLKAPEPNTLELRTMDRLWHRLLSSFGPKFQLIADAPDDLTLN